MPTPRFGVRGNQARSVTRLRRGSPHSSGIAVNCARKCPRTHSIATAHNAAPLDSSVMVLFRQSAYLKVGIG